MKALQLCQNKVRQKKLPMEVIDAEYQWCAFVSIVLPLTHTVQGPTKTDFLLYCGKTHRFPRACTRIVPVRLCPRL